MSSPFTTYVYESLSGGQIDSSILEAAAILFSENYGVWGSEAAVKMGPFAKQGRRVKMSAAKLQEQCLPNNENAQNFYVKVSYGGTLVGNVFATRWHHEGRPVCWITQLVVSSQHRKNGLATKLLLELRKGHEDCGFGILSSHPFAILAALRAFGRGHEEVNLTMTKQHATSIMSGSPVGYVRSAKLKGMLFEDQPEVEGTVSCADTDFFVDHGEPLEALKIIGNEGVHWPFGVLPDGHEFLILVKGRSFETGDRREAQNI